MVRTTIATDRGMLAKYDFSEILDKLGAFNSIVSAATKIGVKMSGNVCADSRFPSSSYRLAGNLSLPSEFHLPLELMKNTGKPSLSGINLEFKESPVGLASTTVNHRDNGYEISLRAGYKVDDVPNLMKRNIDIVKAMVSQFVEEIHEN